MVTTIHIKFITLHDFSIFYFIILNRNDRTVHVL